MIFAYDVEVFSNYFCAVFFNGKQEKTFTGDDLPALRSFIANKALILVGYNNFGYDDLVLRHIHQDKTANTASIKDLSERIITSQGLPDDLFRMQYSGTPWKYSVDVWQLFNKNGSLKEREAREQLPVVMESPVDFTVPLPADKVQQTLDYCRNDCRATWELFKRNKHLVVLRERLRDEYGLTSRVFVSSEASLAQQAVMALHQRHTDQWAGEVRAAAKRHPDNRQTEWSLSDIISPRVRFQTSNYQALLHAMMLEKVHAKDQAGKRWELAKSLQAPVTIMVRKGGAYCGQPVEYQLGTGGLHTVDRPGRFYADKTHAIVDLDVTSYYPSIIIEENLYPAHIGQHFVADFRRLRDQRVTAKQAGDKQTADALKIVINSTFGKLNDIWSPLRSVPNALRVTINGQLFLLMLCELMQLNGCEVISANTDGVTARIPRKGLERTLARIVEQWQESTRHQLERVDYSAYIRRDVNCYVARTVDGATKSKGALCDKPLTGKHDNIAPIIAAQRFLLDNVHPFDSLVEHENPLDFLYYQRVKNGGCISLDDAELGTMARWYVSDQPQGTLYRINPEGSKTQRATIPHGRNVRLAYDVSGWEALPDDADLAYYEAQAWSLIESTKGG